MIQPIKPGGSSKLASLTLGAITGGVADGAAGALAGAGKAAIGGTPAGGILNYQQALARALGPIAQAPASDTSSGLSYQYGPDALKRRFSLFG